MLVVVPSIVMTVVAIVSLIVAIHQYRLNHSDRADSRLNRTIKQVVSEANEPLKQAVNNCTATMDEQKDHINRVEDRLEETSKDIKGLSGKVTEMGVKVDMYWASMLGRNGSGAKHPEA